MTNNYLRMWVGGQGTFDANGETPNTLQLWFD